jgi:hypothetical protein
MVSEMEEIEGPIVLSSRKLDAVGFRNGTGALPFSSKNN